MKLGFSSKKLSVKEIERMVMSALFYSLVVWIESGIMSKGKRSYYFFFRGVKIVKGLPDLILMDGKAPPLFVDIKTQNDRLSDTQKIVFSMLVFLGHKVKIAKQKRNGEVILYDFTPLNLTVLELTEAYKNL